jgi:hypothetical protein
MQLLDQHRDTVREPDFKRTADSFNHVIKLERPWGWLDLAITWCRTEMTGEWRWQIVRMSSDQLPGEYIFYFDSDRDYFAFSLKFQ